MSTAANNLHKSQRVALEAAALMGKNMLAEAALAVRTPLHLKGRRGGRAWSARYLVANDGYAAVFLRGAPPYWREYGTSDGKKILPRKKKALLMPNGKFRASAPHHGVASRPFFQATKKTIAEQSEVVFRRKITESMLSAGLGHR